MVKWNSGSPDDESTPIMHPVRMELAPHARLGRRMAASTAIFVLLVFHVSMIVIGALNYDSNCEAKLWFFLLVYGGVGLLFVYLLFREWLYYARLSSLPTMVNLVLLIIFYACLSTAGGALAYYTMSTRDSCAISAPLLYRWCEAAVLFFAIIWCLFLFVPVVRGLARLILAPCALCMISCVETVGVDVEVGDAGNIAAFGDSFAGEGGGGGGSSYAASGVGGGPGGGGAGGAAGRAGGPNAKQKADAATVTLSLVLCGPCLVACMPCFFCLRPLGKCLKGVLGACCFPFVKVIEGLGCVSFEQGLVSFHNPFSGFSLPTCARMCAQVALAPGCIVPGRSLIALFVNTAALLWFFLYLAFIIYDSWEITCSTYDPGVPFATDPLKWLINGAPSPIHWLLLVFAVAGVVFAVFSFLSDMFTGPKPPPRSFYEATLWRGRRQVKVVFYVLLLMLFLGWGLLLTYYTFTADGCAQQGSERPLQSLYNVAYLLVFLFGVVFVLLGFLGCCVCLDCFISGRLKFVMLLADPEPSLPPPPAMYSSHQSNDEQLVPGVPPRDGYGAQYGATGSSGGGGACLFGAVEEGGSRLCSAGDQPAASFSAPGPKLR